MIPILYSNTEVDYTHNGIAPLKESIEAVVTEEANGLLELYLEYPIQGMWSSEIKDQMFIKAKPNDIDEPHVFRIYEIIKNMEEQMLFVYASSITNDLGLDLVQSATVKDADGQQAMDAIKHNLTQGSNLTLGSDITTKSSTTWSMRNPLNCIVGEEGSIVHFWGGELKRNNNGLYLYTRRGRDNVAVIRQGKNLEGFDMTVSTKGLVTRILPYATIRNPDTGDESEIVGTIVNSPRINNYPVRSLVAIDYSDSEITNVAQLNAAAATYFTTSNPDIDKPTVRLKIDMLQLANTSYYAKFKKLESVGVFDTVTAYVPKFDVNVTVKIRQLEYDVLREKAVRVIAGDPVNDIFSDIRKDYSNAIDDKITHLDTIIQQAANGKNTIWRGVETPVEPHRIGDLWYKPVGEHMVMLQWDGLTWNEILNTEDLESVRREVEAALAKAEEAKLKAEQAYADSVAEAERLVEAQSAAFDTKFETETGAIRDEITTGITDAITSANRYTDAQLLAFDTEFDNITGNIRDEIEQGYADAVTDAKSYTDTQKQAVDAQIDLVKADVTDAKAAADSAINNINTAVVNAGFTSLSDSLTGIKSIADQAKTDAQKGMGDAATALSKANTALSTANSANNKAIKTSVIHWALSSSGTTPPTTGWATTVPTPSSTQFTWSRTTITLNDSSSIYSYNVSKMGAKGDPGAGGAKGDKGEAGVNAPKITAVKQQFYLSSSNTTQTGGSWTETIPVWSTGKYYWTRVVTSYDNATTTPSVAVLDNALNQSLVSALEAKSATQTVATTVSQHATQIAAKANQTTVDTLTGRVSTAEGSITAQAGQIALKANQTNVDTLTGRVQTAEGQINTQAGQIALRVTETQAKSIANSAVDGIEIGGVNLLRNSNFSTGSNGSEYWNRNLGAYVTIAGGKVTITTGTSGAGVYQANTTEATIQGETYTVSAYVKGTGVIRIGFPGASKDQPVASADEWKQYSVTVTRTTSGAVIFYSGSNTSSLEIKNVQLERGNKVSAYKPAIEDTIALISSVSSELSVEKDKITSLLTRTGNNETAITQVKATADGTKTTVSNHAGRLTTVETNVNGLNATVANKADKTELTILSNSISGTVSTAIDAIEIGGVNLIIRKDIQDGKYIDEPSGSVLNAANHSMTGYINVSPNTEYTVSAELLQQIRIVQYNANKTRVAGTLYSGNQGKLKTFRTNSDVSFVRFSADAVTGTHPSLWMFELGNKPSAYKLAPEDDILGGRNYFHRASPVIQKIAAASFILRGSETPNGFRVTGANTYKTTIALQNIITSDGWWTVSFDIKGSQSTEVFVTVDIDGQGAKRIATNRTNTYIRESVSVYISNADSDKDVNFNNFSYAYFWVDNIKVEKSARATDWTPAPEDQVTQTQFTQTVDNFNARIVEKGNVVAQFNMDNGTTLISNKKILLDANTYIMGTTFANDVKAKSIEAVTANITSIRSQILVADVVTATHLKVDIALVDVLTASTAIVDRFFSKVVVTTNLTTKTLSAITANITSIRSQVLVADVVTSTHLKVDNALIDALTATTAIVDRFFTKTAVISNLSTKTLSAITANITSIRSQVLVADSVTSTHIKAENALIDSLFATTALITRLTSKTAFINNIKAITISADKVTTGTLNAANVNIINLNVSKIVGLNSEFVKSAWNGISTRISIDSTAITASDSEGNQAIINTSGEIRSTAGGTDRTRGIFHKGRLWFHTTSGSAVLNIGAHPVVGEGVNRGSIATARAEKLVIGRYNDYLTTNINAKVNPYITLEYGATLGDESNAFTKVWHDLSMNGKFINDVQMVSGFELAVRATSGRLMLGVTGYNTLQVAAANTRSFGNIEMQAGYSVTNASDARWKNVVGETTISALAEIKKMTFVDYYWKQGIQEKQFGLIAQHTPFLAVVNEDGYYGLDNTKQVMLNSLGVKELDKTVIHLSDRVNLMDHRISREINEVQMIATNALTKTQELEKRIEELENEIELLKSA